jgi:hypothetical protein
VISWKNSFKRLNEEYDLAKKKTQAVDNLYITGKISQFTRDIFNKDINSTIVEIERQQKDLVEKMQLKTDELTSQIKLLETLLANYEIQYVVGEIGDETYHRDILLFTIGIDTAKTELDTITQATLQLCRTVPTIQAPITPDIPVTETVIETHVTTEPIASVEISMPLENPVESMPLETTSFEATPTPIEEPTMELTTETTSAIEEVPVMESAIEEVPFDAVESFVSVDADESVIEVTATDPVFLTATSAVVEVPVMESTYDIVEETPLESVVMDLPVEDVTMDIVEEQTIADVPLQVFEVTEQTPVEQTLEKVLEQLNSPAVEALAVEELTHSSHPTTAPHQALSEITAEAVSDGQIDESDVDTTE